MRLAGAIGDAIGESKLHRAQNELWRIAAHSSPFKDLSTVSGCGDQGKREVTRKRNKACEEGLDHLIWRHGGPAPHNLRSVPCRRLRNRTQPQASADRAAGHPPQGAPVHFGRGGTPPAQWTGKSARPRSRAVRGGPSTFGRN